MGSIFHIYVFYVPVLTFIGHLAGKKQYTVNAYTPGSLQNQDIRFHLHHSDSISIIEGRVIRIIT